MGPVGPGPRGHRYPARLRPPAQRRRVRHPGRDRRRLVPDPRPDRGGLRRGDQRALQPAAPARAPGPPRRGGRPAVAGPDGAGRLVQPHAREQELHRARHAGRDPHDLPAAAERAADRARARERHHPQPLLLAGQPVGHPGRQGAAVRRRLVPRLPADLRRQHLALPRPLRGRGVDPGGRRAALLGLHGRPRPADLHADAKPARRDARHVSRRGGPRLHVLRHLHAGREPGPGRPVREPPDPRHVLHGRRPRQLPQGRRRRPVRAEPADPPALLPWVIYAAAWLALRKRLG